MQLSFVLSASLISMSRLEDWNNNVKCYTSQPEYVFRLEEKVSRAVGQNSLTPLGRTKLTNSQGRAKLTNSLGKQQLKLSTRSWSGRAPWNHGKFVCRPEHNFCVGKYNKTLNDWPHGKHWVLFPLDPQCLMYRICQWFGWFGCNAIWWKKRDGRKPWRNLVES